jgi:hypothetical protein
MLTIYESTLSPFQHCHKVSFFHCNHCVFGGYRRVIYVAVIVEMVDHQFSSFFLFYRYFYKKKTALQMLAEHYNKDYTCDITVKGILF